jgi:HNH endonuclease
MNAVRPEARTTLLLNANYMPINITTARAAFNHVITGRVKPIDRFGMPHGFPDDEKGHPINDIVQHYWFLFKDVLKGKTDKDGIVTPYDENDGIYYKDQPVLRSANLVWPIPTVALTTTRFFKHRPNGKVTIQKLAKHYKNVCQICNCVFPTSKLTIEHVIPQAKDGPTDESNCIPTCQPCNSQKADITPYYDVAGVDLEKKVKTLPTFLVAAGTERRKEWEDYIVFGGRE